MATKQENEDIKTLQADMSNAKTDIAVMKNDIGYIKGTAEKLDKFIEDNKRGITTASILDNKIVTFVLGGIVIAGGIIAAKGSL